MQILAAENDPISSMFGGFQLSCTLPAIKLSFSYKVQYNTNKNNIFLLSGSISVDVTTNYIHAIVNNMLCYPCRKTIISACISHQK